MPSQVYLQAQGGPSGQADDWNARFSSMMFKVLQGTYQGSQLALEADQHAAALASANYDTVDDSKVGRCRPLGLWNLPGCTDAGPAELRLTQTGVSCRRRGSLQPGSGLCCAGGW